MCNSTIGIKFRNVMVHIILLGLTGTKYLNVVLVIRYLFCPLCIKMFVARCCKVNIILTRVENMYIVINLEIPCISMRVARFEGCDRKN